MMRKSITFVPFPVSLEKAEQYIRDLLIITRYAQNMLDSDADDTSRPYWSRLIDNNRVRLTVFLQYRNLLHLRS